MKRQNLKAGDKIKVVRQAIYSNNYVNPVEKETIKIIAKIENQEGVTNVCEILSCTYGLMVARGDLAMEIPGHKVPIVQKRLIKEAIKAQKASIVATQMLHSMIESPRPTRAEINDVANAIYDGTDAVMLSAETAVGKYPIEAVRAMVRIINEIERATASSAPRRRTSDYPELGEGQVEDSIAVATCAAAEMLKVPLICCFTKSGFTARKISSFRPRTAILGLSPMVIARISGGIPP